MAGRRRTHAELARDRRREADLYLEGWLQAEIAADLHLSEATVCRDLQAMQAEWLTSSLVDFDRAKAKELAAVDKLEREYWRAWQRSCEDAETERVEGTVEEPGKVVRTRKGQAGDPRFLAGVQWCIERRCKILGLDAPERMDWTSGGHVIRIEAVEVGGIDPDEDL